MFNTDDEYFAWAGPRIEAAFNLEIKPTFLRLLREHYERTGERDIPAAVTVEAASPAEHEMVFVMESGAVHRIPFALTGREH